MQLRRQSSRSLGILLLVSALAVSAGPAHAQYSWWTNTSSGNFSDPNNWSNGVPNLGATASNAVFAVPGATYTVTWTETTTNFTAIISNNNQNITWDLGGFTNRYQQVYGNTALFLSPNASETNHLLIINGGVIGGGGNPSLLAMVGPGSTVTASNGAKVALNLSIGGYLSAGGTLTVTGPGTYWNAPDVAQSRNVYVRDGGTAVLQGGTSINFLTVDGGTVTSRVAQASISGDRTAVINGGLLVGQANTLMGFGDHGSGQATVTVGRATDTLTSVLQTTGGISLNRAGTDHRTDVYLEVNSNGVVRLLRAAAAAGAGAIMYTNAALYGRSDLYINDESVLTLNNGRIEATTNTFIDVANQLQVIGYNPAANTTKAPGLLRGTGQIIRTNAGVNFQIRNDGWIKPGDTSSTPGLGTLTIVGGDLLMTNAVATKAGLYFEFSDTALDQIVINDGFARLTHGSNVFALASSTVNYPSPGVKWGLGTYDFLTADSIDYTPVYDNLTNVLAFYGLVQNLDYNFGVVDLGNGIEVLRLEFVPEPSTVLLLVGGGLLVWRFRKRR